MSTPANPFAAPAIPPSTFPTVESFRGRLVAVTPVAVDTVPDNFSQVAGATKTRVTANVTLMDSDQPVPLFKNRAATGNTMAGPEFPKVWFEGSYLVEQLRPYAGTGQMVLGVIDTRTPGTQAVKGNPWGMTAATPEQTAHAVQVLNTRALGAAAAPAPVPSSQPAALSPAAAVPSPAQTPTVPTVPAPGSAPAGVNPFL